MPSIDLSIVIPVYNSQWTLSEICKRLFDVGVKQNLQIEILLVDDASTDKSWEEIKKLAKTHAAVCGFRLAKNVGQMKASIWGISQTTGTYIVTIDDDLEYHPEDIILLFKHLKDNQLDIVFGLSKEKYSKQGKNTNMAILRNKILNWFWGKGVTDSFKIFERSLVFEQSGAFIPSIHFEAYLKQIQSYTAIGYQEVGFKQRQYGVSNYHFLQKAKTFVALSIDYYPWLTNKPFTLITCLTGLSLLFAAYFSVGTNCFVLFLTGFIMTIFAVWLNVYIQKIKDQLEEKILVAEIAKGQGFKRQDFS